MYDYVHVRKTLERLCAPLPLGALSRSFMPSLEEGSADAEQDISRDVLCRHRRVLMYVVSFQVRVRAGGDEKVGSQTVFYNRFPRLVQRVRLMQCNQHQRSIQWLAPWYQRSVRRPSGCFGTRLVEHILQDVLDSRLASLYRQAQRLSDPFATQGFRHRPGPALQD